jgi:ribosomal protein S18 acetylase RimI-like enzyme
MIAPAQPVHFKVLQDWIRRGAAKGSFDADLAANSGESTVFFANLHQALQTGVFLQQDASGNVAPTSASGYIYWPDDGDRNRPIGFGLFKALADACFELWLTAVDGNERGRGHGRAMLASLLRTPAGRLAYVVRVNRDGPDASAMLHLVESLGFRIERETSHQYWLVRTDAPPSVATAIRHARLVHDRAD